jgi:hypothetical protein
VGVPVRDVPPATLPEPPEPLPRGVPPCPGAVPDRPGAVPRAGRLLVGGAVLVVPPPGGDVVPEDEDDVPVTPDRLTPDAWVEVGVRRKPDERPLLVPERVVPEAGEEPPRRTTVPEPVVRRARAPVRLAATDRGRAGAAARARAGVVGGAKR